MSLIPVVAKGRALPIQNITFNLIFLVLAGVITALACGLGAIPVFFVRNRMTAWRPILHGITAGLMTAASVDFWLDRVTRLRSNTKVKQLN